jgi:acetylornithine deacetylase/succinyl-diaminopimelate desuccinylase-like protein
MADFLVDELKALGANVETRDLGKQDWHGTSLDLPPIVLATVGNDPQKKTILVYGHYDVQPVSEWLKKKKRNNIPPFCRLLLKTVGIPTLLN